MVLLDLARCQPFICFELVPVVENIRRRREISIAENMRVTQYKLFGHAVSHVIDRKITSLGADGRVKNDLQQEVAEFLAKVRGIAGLVGLVNGVKGFVRLLEQVLCERRIGLLMVPGTSAGGTKTGHYSDKFIKRSGHKG